MNDKYLKQIEETLKVMSDKKFIVRDLFVGALFDDLSEQERMQIGKEFLSYAKTHSDIIETMYDENNMLKTDLNQQIYKKKG